MTAPPLILSDLENLPSDLVAHCNACGHAEMVEKAKLIKLLDGEMPLRRIALRMFCSTCGTRDVRLELGPASRVPN